MKKIVSFVLRVFCIFAVVFSLSTLDCLANDGNTNKGNGKDDSSITGDGDKDKDKDKDINKGNTIPPIIIRPI